MNRFINLAMAPIYSVFLFALGACNAQATLPSVNEADALAIQGEYRGAWKESGNKLAVQVVARAESEFRILFFDKGLPGDSSGFEVLAELGGAAANDAVAFTGEGFSASRPFAEEKITGTHTQRGEFTLEKIHRLSGTAGKAPPAEALVLFDGTGAAEWVNGQLDADGHLLPGATSLKKFRDFFLHLEFRTPFQPQAFGQNRGNSGIFLQQRYELQILDSFGLNPFTSPDTLEPKRHCGAIWEQFAPALNACFPPGTWQTYDIEFRAARFDSTSTGWVKTEAARLTVRLNGILIHDDIGLINSTLLGQPESAAPGPLFLQKHGQGVVFRNIWIVENPETASLLKPGYRSADGNRNANGIGEKFGLTGYYSSTLPGVAEAAGPLRDLSGRMIPER